MKITHGGSGCPPPAISPIRIAIPPCVILMQIASTGAVETMKITHGGSGCPPPAISPIRIAIPPCVILMQIASTGAVETMKITHGGIGFATRAPGWSTARGQRPGGRRRSSSPRPAGFPARTPAPVSPKTASGRGIRRPPAPDLPRPLERGEEERTLRARLFLRALRVAADGDLDIVREEGGGGVGDGRREQVPDGLVGRDEEPAAGGADGAGLRRGVGGERTEGSRRDRGTIGEEGRGGRLVPMQEELRAAANFFILFILLIMFILIVKNT